MADGLRDLLVGDWWRYTISFVGTVVLAVGIGSLLLDSQLTNEELLQGALLLVSSLLLIAIGARIALEIRAFNQMALILGWMGLGILVTGTMGIWGIIVLPTVEVAFEAAVLFLSVLATGALFGAVVGYYDIRVRTLAERAGHEQARREFLDDQQETLSSLNGILRHQILNDLSAISGRAELLDSGKIDIADGTDSILRHCEHMEMTVNRIETLVAILTHVSDATDLELSRAIERATAVAQETHPELSVTVDADSVSAVRADELLHLALAELFKNSAEHGDGAVRVRVTERVETISLAISDNGPGVDIAEETLFDPNTRGPESDGDGLGLYFVDLIVDRYGGSIRLATAAEIHRGNSSVVTSDTENDGATFILEIPIDNPRLPDEAVALS